MTALAHRHSHAAVTPLVHEHAARLQDPGTYRDAWNLDPRHPGPATLSAMKRELQDALVPCTGPEAVAAAATLIEAYPQADKTSGTYAELLARRLSVVPPDLLPKVLDAILDDNPDFRPAPGAVTRTVDRIVGKRTRLLRQVDEALDWYTRKAEADRLAAETRARIEADRLAWLALPEDERRRRMTVRDTATGAPVVTVLPAYLSPEQLSRIRKPAISQESASGAR